MCLGEVRTGRSKKGRGDPSGRSGTTKSRPDGPGLNVHSDIILRESGATPSRLVKTVFLSGKRKEGTLHVYVGKRNTQYYTFSSVLHQVTTSS